jgi:hypothetical protein
MIRVLRLISWPAWLGRLFDDNGWWVMLVIVEQQWALMMSRYRSCEMKFYFFHLRHDLHICSFVSRALFAKHSFWKDLVRIKMSFVREMNILSVWFHRVVQTTMIILHSQLFIFEVNELDFDHAIALSFGLSSTACSFHGTRRTIQLKMIYLNLSRLISYEIFFVIQHLSQLIIRHLQRSSDSSFVYATRCIWSAQLTSLS